MTQPEMLGSQPRATRLVASTPDAGQGQLAIVGGECLVSQETKSPKTDERTVPKDLDGTSGHTGQHRR